MPLPSISLSQHEAEHCGENHLCSGNFEPTVEIDVLLRVEGLQPLERMMELAEVKTHAQL